MMKRFCSTLYLLFSLFCVGSHADVFGTGTNSFTLEFVGIGNPGNPANPTNNLFGSVSYTYEIGIHEITIQQFVRAAAADSRIGDGDEDYWNDGIRTVGSNAPVSHVSWYEAARFANWLTTGDAYSGAYVFDTNGVLMAVDRVAAATTYGTIYVLPTEDEWYKAAFYRPVNDGSYSLYSSGLNSFPVHGTTNGWNFNSTSLGTVNSEPNYMWEVGYGGMDQNGTYDMNGNIWELCESAFEGPLDVVDEGRVIRNGSALDYAQHQRATNRHPAWDPAEEHELVGLRVAVLRAYWLDVTIAGSGTVSVADGWLPAGTNLTIDATPATNWLFMGWSGDVSGSYVLASTNMVVTNAISITATFSDDADEDGLLNSDESTLGTDPRDADTDKDGLSDGEEVLNHGTNPLDADSDNDSFDDYLEVANGGNPLVSDAWRIDYIRSHGAEYDLYSSNAIVDVFMGKAGFCVSNDTAWLSLQLEVSQDLVNWTNGGDAVIWSIPVDSSNAFYRVRSER